MHFIINLKIYSMNADNFLSTNRAFWYDLQFLNFGNAFKAYLGMTTRDERVFFL